MPPHQQGLVDVSSCWDLGVCSVSAWPRPGPSAITQARSKAHGTL